MTRTSIITLALGLTLATAAMAQPTLTASSPAQNAVVAKATEIALSFSEPVNAKATSVELVMTSMPGMTMHDPMRIGGYKLAPAADGKALTVKFGAPLPKGGYSLAWKTAGKDGQRASGALRFTVQ